MKLLKEAAGGAVRHQRRLLRLRRRLGRARHRRLRGARGDALPLRQRGQRAAAGRRPRVDSALFSPLLFNEIPFSLSFSKIWKDFQRVSKHRSKSPLPHFLSEFQLLSEVYASRVGDGICDCCDGSDEAREEMKTQKPLEV